MRPARRAYSAIQAWPQQAAPAIGKPSLAPRKTTVTSGRSLRAWRRASACQSSIPGLDMPVEIRASLADAHAARAQTRIEERVHDLDHGIAGGQQREPPATVPRRDRVCDPLPRRARQHDPGPRPACAKGGPLAGGHAPAVPRPPRRSRAKRGAQVAPMPAVGHAHLHALPRADASWPDREHEPVGARRSAQLRGCAHRCSARGGGADREVPHAAIAAPWHRAADSRVVGGERDGGHGLARAVRLLGDGGHRPGTPVEVERHVARVARPGAQLQPLVGAGAGGQRDSGHHSGRERSRDQAAHVPVSAPGRRARPPCPPAPGTRRDPRRRSGSGRRPSVRTAPTRRQ